MFRNKKQIKSQEKSKKYAIDHNIDQEKSKSQDLTFFFFIFGPSCRPRDVRRQEEGGDGGSEPRLTLALHSLAVQQVPFRLSNDLNSRIPYQIILVSTFYILIFRCQAYLYKRNTRSVRLSLALYVPFRCSLVCHAFCSQSFSLSFMSKL